MRVYTRKKKKIKKVTGIICYVLISFFILNICALVISTPIIYNSIFIGYSLPDYEIVPGLVNYKDIETTFPRKQVTFTSGNNTLMGYKYVNDTTEKLVIVAPGMGSGADSYLTHEKYFYDQGYSIFSYDPTGTYRSEGETTNGFPQAISDLDSALAYLSYDEDFRQKDIYLFGHSWGAYAACSILNIKAGIKGVFAINGANSADEVVLNQARKYVGFLADISSPFVFGYQQFRFGDYAKFTAVDGINISGTITLLFHGKYDNTFPINSNSAAIYNHFKEITNNNCSLYLYDYEYADHVGVLYSDNANQYRKEIKEKIDDLKKQYNGDIPYNVLKDYVSTVDDAKYSEVNLKMMNTIINTING